MTTATIPQLTYSGKPIAMDQVGELRRSDDIIDDRDALWERMEEDGYLFLPGYLDRREVLAARAELCDRLFKAGVLDPSAAADGRRSGHGQEDQSGGHRPFYARFSAQQPAVRQGSPRRPDDGLLRVLLRRPG